MTATATPKYERRLWLGLSTDPKPLPTAPVGNLTPLPGDLFFCTDTSLCYVYDPALNAWASWPALSVVTGGGGGGGNVFVTNFPATQPISAASLPLPSGAATQSTLAAIETTLGTPMQQTGGSVAITGTPTVNVNGTVPVSATSLPLPSGAATASGVAAVAAALGTPMQQTGGSVAVTNLPATQPVSVAAPIAVTQSGAWAVSLNGQPVAISAASLPLPTGAATLAEQQTINTSIQQVNTTLGAPLQAGGSVSVSNFPATQPVSIATPVAVTQSGAWSVSINGQPVAISATSLPLPTGASTAAGQAAIIAALGSPLQESGGSVSIAGTPTVSVTNLPATQPVSGTVAVSNLPAEGQALSAASLPVVIASDQSTVPVSVAAIALPANAAQESGGNLDTLSQLVIINRLMLSELKAMRLMQAAVMGNGSQVDPLATLQESTLN